MAMNSNDDDNNSNKNPIIIPKKVKSCKDTLYYSFGLQSKAKNPRCVGFTGTLPQVPQSIFQEAKIDPSKDDHPHFKDFYYACAGYSVYLDQTGKESSGDVQTATELPLCNGLRFLADKRVTTGAPAVAPTPAHALNKDDGSWHSRSVFVVGEHLFGAVLV